MSATYVIELIQEKARAEDVGAIRAWFEAHDGDEYDCRDNERVALVGDADAEAQYERQVASSCCGFEDEEVQVNGRTYRVGFNYGH